MEMPLQLTVRMVETIELNQSNIPIQKTLSFRLEANFLPMETTMMRGQERTSFLALNTERFQMVTTKCQVFLILEELRDLILNQRKISDLGPLCRSISRILILNGIQKDAFQSIVQP